MLEVRLFGEARFIYDGAPWTLAAPPRTIPLFAYLLLHRGESVTRARLATLLWPDLPEEDGRTNLRRHLHRLTQALPAAPSDTPWLIVSNTTISLNPKAEIWLDVDEFERLVADPATASDGVALYRGDLVADCYDDWIVIERERLRSRALDELYSCALNARTRRSYADASLHLERMLTIDEWREDALRLQMSVKYESGDRSGALALYERFAHRLQSEMHIDPMPETTTLRDAILGDRLSSAHGHDGHDASHAGARRGLHLPFVGRVEALESLSGKWTRAARNAGSMVFVIGEPGIGKSRLANELASVVEAEGGRILIGTTSSPESMPYQPLIDALRRGITYLQKGNLEPLWMSVLASVLPELLSLHPHLEAAEPIDDGPARARLHEAFARAFASIARARPLLLVLEDIHWSGAETIEALGTLARRCGGLSIAIVATYRGDQADNALRDARRALQREGRAASVVLSRLGEQDIEEIIRETPELRNAPAELAKAIYRSSEGNPLFAVQLIQSFLETQHLPSPGGSNVVTDAIAERLARLPEDARAVLDVCATIGREFTLDVVCEVGGWSEDHVLGGLGVLMDRHLVRETGSPDFEYGFTHALIAQTAYSLTRPEARAGRHRRIAERLEQRADANEIAATIARHWRGAGNKAKSSQAYRRAAERAIGIYARTDAIEYAREGLLVVQDVRDRYDLLRALTQAEQHFGDVNAWDRDLDELERAASHLGDDEKFEAASARERYYAQVGKVEKQAEVLREMLRIADATGSSERRALALDARGQQHARLGDFPAALEAFREARTLVPKSHRLFLLISQHVVGALSTSGDVLAARDEMTLLSSLSPSSIVERLSMLWAESTIANALEDGPWMQRVASEMVALSARIGDEASEARAQWVLACGSHMSGELSVARSQYDVAAAMFERLRAPAAVSATYINMGVICVDSGLLDEAIDLSMRGAEIARNAGAKNLLASAMANQADAERLKGNHPLAIELCIDALEIARTTGEQRLIGQCLQTLGASQCKTGSPAEGIENLRRAADAFRSAQNARCVADTLPLLIEALLEDGRGSELAEPVQELSAIVSGNTKLRHTGPIWYALAQAARVNGNSSEASRRYKRAQDELSAALTAFHTDDERSAYLQLPFNQRILERGSTAVTNRKGRHDLQRSESALSSRS